jgi:hypothetical protein
MTDFSNTEKKSKPNDEANSILGKSDIIIRNVTPVRSISEPGINNTSPSDLIGVQDLEKEGKAKVAIIMSTLCVSCVFLLIIQLLIYLSFVSSLLLLIR